jgi:hypothetical protein
MVFNGKLLKNHFCSTLFNAGDLSWSPSLVVTFSSTAWKTGLEPSWPLMISNLLSKQLPSGNQTWQWKVPCKIYGGLNGIWNISIIYIVYSVYIYICIHNNI